MKLSDFRKPVDSKTQTAWLLRSHVVEARGQKKYQSHKVKIHRGDGSSEVKFVNDAELDTIRRDQHVSRVEHLLELTDKEHQYVNADGQIAHINSHKYSDESLGEDHYVHVPNARTSVHDTFDQAHKKLMLLGFKPTGNIE